MVLGSGLLLAPLFFGNSPLGKALSNLSILGLIMFAAGGLFVWRWKSARTSQESPDSGSRARARSPAQVPEASLRPGARRHTASGGDDSIARATDQAAAVIDRVARSSGGFVGQKEDQLQRGAAPETKPSAWSDAVFRVIEWRRFEALVETLFGQAGFHTQSQSHGADDGIDIWLYSRNQPGEPVSLVQCKHWQGRRVGVDKIRELKGVMASRGVMRGQFATTSTFTPDAHTFARNNGINLLDVNGLRSLIGQRTPEQQQALLEVALQGDYWRPTCVNCGIKMVSRTSRVDGSSFWGCENFPRCRTTMPMRSS